PRGRGRKKLSPAAAALRRRLVALGAVAADLDDADDDGGGGGGGARPSSSSPSALALGLPRHGADAATRWRAYAGGVTGEWAAGRALAAAALRGWAAAAACDGVLRRVVRSWRAAQVRASALPALAHWRLLVAQRRAVAVIATALAGHAARA